MSEAAANPKSKKDETKEERATRKAAKKVAAEAPAVCQANKIE